MTSKIRAALVCVLLVIAVNAPGQRRRGLTACSDLTVMASNDGPACRGVAIHATATTNATDPSFAWTSQLHKTGGPLPGQTVTIPDGYDGDWTVEVTDHATGCTATAVTTVAYADPGPMAIDTTGHPSCSDSGPFEAQLIEDTQSGPWTSIAWTADGGMVTAGQGTRHVTITPTSHDTTQTIPITLGVEATASATGCHTATSTYFYLYGRQPATPLIAPETACPGVESMAYIDGMYYRVTWSATNATLNLHGAATSAYFTPTGEGPVTLTVTYNQTQYETCPATSTATIAVGGSGPSATIDQPQILGCEGATVAIPVTLGGTPPFTIVWSDGLVETNVLETHHLREVVAGDARVYTITNVADANCSAMNPSSATVSAAAQAVITSGPASQTIAAGARATLSVTASGGGLSYQWFEGSTGDATKPVGENSPTFLTPPLDATHAYWVRVTGPCGSASSNTAVVAAGHLRARSTKH